MPLPSLPAQLLGILAGLAAAAVWGASDFSGGFATRRNHPVLVLAISTSAGLAVLTALALLTESQPNTSSGLGWQDIAWSITAGVCGGVGLVSLYQGLALGSAAVVSPTAAVIGAAVPVVAGALLEGIPPAVQLSGFMVGIGGIWLVSRSSQDQSGADGRSMLLAVIAGLGFGGFYVFLGQVASPQIFAPLAVTKSVQVVLSLAITAVLRVRIAHRQDVRVALFSGVLDAGGNTFFLLAQNLTRLDAAAVLASMYPAGTVLLSSLILKEKVSRAQWLGVALCLSAVALIAV